MIHILYQIIAWIIFLVLLPVFLVYTLSGGGQELRQRLGFYSPPQKAAGSRRIWLHAASVGEVQVARALVREIERQLPGTEIWVSTLTRHGLEVCREQMPPTVNCLFAPLDLAGVCSRALDAIRPDIYVCLETELWPEMIRQAATQGVVPVLLNARLSAKSLARYRRWPARPLFRATVGRFQAIAAIGPDDAQRYQELGADPAVVTISGNAKYDLNPAAAAAEQQRPVADPVAKIAEPPPPRAPAPADDGRLRELLGIGQQQPVLVCGSTHEGEEELLLAAWHRLKRNLPGLVLIIAPRHLKRLPEIEADFQQRDLAYHKLSELPLGRNHDIQPGAPGSAPAAGKSGPAPNCPRRPPGRQATVIVVDKMGELADLYQVADYVFCGGSLVRRGGHNLLEAAFRHKPVLFGPHMDDFREDADLLIEGGGGFLVRGDEDICQRIMAFHTRPAEYHQAAARAGQLAGRLRGAARQQVKILKAEILKR